MASAGMRKARQLDISETNIAGLGTELEKQVRESAAQTEEAWHGAGTEPGTLVWRIENFKVVPWPKEDIGVFYSGDSFIVLHTYKKPDTPALLHNVHFWLGLKTTQDEAGTAAYKTVELDDFLHGIPVQYREIQGAETPLFISYFPTFRVMEGGVASGFRHVKPEEYTTRLLQVKGTRKSLVVREVPLTFKSLNSGDVFIADAGSVLYQWNGKQSNGQEKHRAMEFTRALAGERKGKVEVFDEGDRDAMPFWKAIGGEGPVATAEEGGDDKEVRAANEHKLLRVTGGADGTGSFATELVASGKITKAHFTSGDVYIFDADTQVFAWIGSQAPKAAKSRGLQFAVTYLVKAGRSPTTPVGRVIEGGESQTFVALLSK